MNLNRCYNKHPELEGKHAVLSPSRPGWEKRSVDDVINYVLASKRTEAGTVVHELAETLIKHNIKLSKSDKKMLRLKLLENHIPMAAVDIDYIFNNLINYVNDGIGFRLVPEQILKYSDNCFGTADTISPLESVYKNKFLRIHDLKTGTSKTHIEQLEKYAAIFFLEYGINPKDIDVELRIYQGGEIITHEPTIDEIVPIMDTIVTFDKIIDRAKEE